MPISPISPYPCLSRQFSCALSRLRSFFHHHHHHHHHHLLLTVSLLESCESSREFAQLHARIIRKGEHADSFMATRMLEFCASVSLDMATATRIFDDLDRPHNVYAWTAMIRGFANAKDAPAAISFYERMLSHGVQPYKFTFLPLLKACSAVRDLRRGCCAHASVTKVGLQTDAYLRSALVNLYGCCGHVHAAHRVFLEGPENNCVISNAMLVAAFSNGKLDMATKLFDEMPQRDLTTWNVVVNGFSKLGRMDLAESFFRQMSCKNLMTWSSMVVGYVQSGRAVEALRLFEEMLVAGVRSDSVTIASVLAACSQVGALDVGKWIHAYWKKSDFECDVVLGTSLVDMYAKCGCIDLALQVFNCMKHKNISSWNAMLGGLAMHGRGHDVLALFEKFESLNIEPTDVTFVAVLSACSHIGAVEEGRRQFDCMNRKYKIAPKIEHFGCLVDMFSRAGLIGEAKDVILNMPMEPNLIILGAFLNACMIHGYPRTGKLVARQISRLYPEDTGYYVLLSNIFASVNEWEAVSNFRKLIKRTRARKIPGCSSIEVGSMIHEFVVEDRSHPNWQDIFDVLDKLNAHLEGEGYVPFLCNIYNTD